VLANIYYFIDVSLKKGVRGVMFLTFFLKQKQIVLNGESTNKTGGRV
jgi:hypothetical protein